MRRLLAVDGGSVELRAAAAGGLDVVVRLRPAQRAASLLVSARA